jgi:hypothetical protein
MFLEGENRKLLEKLKDLEAQNASLVSRSHTDYLNAHTVGRREGAEEALRWAWKEYLRDELHIDPQGFVDRGLRAVCGVKR